jgi:type IV pilus assembly protein PilB
MKLDDNSELEMPTVADSHEESAEGGFQSSAALVRQASNQRQMIDPAAIRAAQAKAENLQRERFAKVKNCHIYLRRDLAEKHLAVVLERRGRENRQFTVGLVNVDDSLVRENIARALRSSRPAIKWEQLDAMEWDALVRHAYGSDLATTGAGNGTNGNGKMKDVPFSSSENTSQNMTETRIWGGDKNSLDGAAANGGAANGGAGDAAFGTQDEEAELEAALFANRLDLTNVEEIKQLAMRDESELETLEFIKVMLHRFVESRSSDCHTENGSQVGGRIRFRLDGELITVWAGIPLARYKRIVNGLCNLSDNDFVDMQFAEVNGIIKIRILRNNVPTNMELRFSSVPSAPLPSVVLRLQAKPLTDLNESGFFPNQIELIEMARSQDRGWVITTGATGQGKTNTLFALLSALADEDKWKIIEIAKPLEIESQRWVQIPIRPNASKYTVAHALENVLQQDPDIISIGEARTREYADVALNAALTGHLVFTTYHASMVEDTLARLFSMGLARDTLSTALKCIIAQRLVRKLCEDCKEIDLVRSQAFGQTLYRAVGCYSCLGKGYKGRTAIAEVLFVDDEIGDWINSRLTAKEIVKKLLLKRMPHDPATPYFMPLKVAAKAKLLQGITSYDEILGTLGTARQAANASEEGGDYSASGNAKAHSRSTAAGTHSAVPDDDDVIDAEYTMIEPDAEDAVSGVNLEENNDDN